MRHDTYRELRAALDRNELIVVATVVAGPGLGAQLLIWSSGETSGDLGWPQLNQQAVRHAELILEGAQSGKKTFRRDEAEVVVFFDVIPPPPELVVIGAVHVAVPLTSLAKTLGFRTVIVDPRSAFATAERFPEADQIVPEWPQQAFGRKVELHEGSYVAVLSHDFKIDLPALEAALASKARYIGALGSRKTHGKRIEALRQLGFDDPSLDRIHSPIGLNLGGRRAEEIALAILAEMVAVSHGRPKDADRSHASR